MHCRAYAFWLEGVLYGITNMSTEAKQAIRPIVNLVLRAEIACLPGK